MTWGQSDSLLHLASLFDSRWCYCSTRSPKSCSLNLFLLLILNLITKDHESTVNAKFVPVNGDETREYDSTRLWCYLKPLLPGRNVSITTNTIACRVNSLVWSCRSPIGLQHRYTTSWIRHEVRMTTKWQYQSLFVQWSSKVAMDLMDERLYTKQTLSASYFCGCMHAELHHYGASYDHTLLSLHYTLPAITMCTPSSSNTITTQHNASACKIWPFQSAAARRCSSDDCNRSELRCFAKIFMVKKEGLH